jgi:outer membrane protein TolC
MVDVTPMVPGDRQVIESYGEGRFRVTGVAYKGSILVFPNRVVDWPLADIGELVPEQLSDVMVAEPPVEVDPGRGLDGQDTPDAPMGLSQAIRQAVRANLDVRIARLLPTIRQSQVVEAEADFDPTAFAEYTYRSADQPVQGSSVLGVPTSATAETRTSHNVSAGVSQPLQTGGELTVSTGFDRVEDDSPNLTLTPNPGTTSNITAALNHPLLRNFGVAVNRARIDLAENAQGKQVIALRSRLLDVVSRVENAYWNLLLAWRQVGIRQHTLELTVETERELKARQGVDASPLQLAQAASFVEQRRSDLINARRQLHDASDRLKRLINSEDLPLDGETVIKPTDLPTERPLRMTASTAIETGLARRPEVNEAALNVDDAAIRLAVAENQKLPLLNLEAQARLFGLEGDVGESYDTLGEGQFVDYRLGARFEAPIGNRAAGAAYTRARLSRQAQTISLRRASDEVILSIKQAMRAARSARERIATTRAARAATRENLRTLEQREETGEALTPEFLLDLKLNTQRRYAEAQLREIAAIIEYNAARARFLAAIGTLLEQRGITMDRWPVHQQP